MLLEQVFLPSTNSSLENTEVSSFENGRVHFNKFFILFVRFSLLLPKHFSHVLSLCSVRVVCLYCALKITIMNTPHIFRLVCIPFLGASLFFCCHFCFNIDLLEFFVMKNVFRSFVFAIGLCAKSVFLLHKWIKMKLKQIYESRIAVVWNELITAHFGIAMNLDFFFPELRECEFHLLKWTFSYFHFRN